MSLCCDRSSELEVVSNHKANSDKTVTVEEYVNEKNRQP